METRDIIIILIVAVWVTASVIYMVRRKKQGKNISCGGDCSSCSGCCKFKENK